MKRSVKIVNKLGLHARAAAQLVQVASGYAADLMLEKDGQRVNGKSIMGVMMLAAAQGDSVEIEGEGDDAGALLDAVEALVAARFNEEK